MLETFINWLDIAVYAVVICLILDLLTGRRMGFVNWIKDKNK